MRNEMRRGNFYRVRRRFAPDSRGSTAVIFAIFIPVMLLLVGGAIDFSRMMQLRAQLQDAADAASVGSVGVNSTAFKLAVAMPSDGTITSGASQAKSIFYANMPTKSDLSGVSFRAVVAKDGTTITSTDTVNATYKSSILGLLNTSFANFPISITSTSSATMPPYIDFYLLLDNSPSMGVGATTADISKMVAATATKTSDANCAFACHQLDKPSTGPNMDYYNLAKSIGVTTRIDVLRQATQNLMTTATNTETIAKQYRMAIYDFGDSATSIDAQNPTASQIGSLTADLTSAASDAAAIDLMTVPYQNYNSDRQSNMSSVLIDMNKRIPSAGSGLNAGSPQEVLFFVSDGTMDSYDCAYSNGSTCRRITPIDTTQCKAMKARGVRIAVLYTTYLPLPTNSFYNSYVAKYVTPTSQIAAAMEDCASPGLYFEVSPSEGISDAMNALFKKVVSTVRISQ